jgi:hypothetical protein
VQVDTINPTLKSPKTNSLKLNYDETLSGFAFKFNLRRYTKGWNCNLEVWLSVTIGLLCGSYSLACVEAAAARSAEIHALVLVAAFAASFVFLADTATAVAPTIAAIVIQHSVLVATRATAGSHYLASTAIPGHLDGHGHPTPFGGGGGPGGGGGGGGPGGGEGPGPGGGPGGPGGGGGGPVGGGGEYDDEYTLMEVWDTLAILVTMACFAGVMCAISRGEDDRARRYFVKEFRRRREQRRWAALISNMLPHTVVGQCRLNR